jgi:hypothetical protein
VLQGSPGHEGSHFDPNNTGLFQPSEGGMVKSSNACLLAVVAILAASTVALGPIAMFNL